MNLAASMPRLPARRHLLTAVLWWGAAGCAVLGVLFPPAASATELREVAPFTALDLRTVARVDVRQGEVQSVEVDAEPAAAAQIETSVAGDTLTVRDRAGLRLFPMPPVRITIVARRLSAVAVSGATRLSLEPQSTQELTLAAAGSSAVKASGLDVKRLHVQASGSSSVTLSGRTNELSLALNGASAVEAAGLAAQAVSLSTGGSSRARVWAHETLSASLSGSSSARYFGRPAVSASTSGAAWLTRLDETPPAR
jgi:hypothetical protein